MRKYVISARRECKNEYNRNMVYYRLIVLLRIVHMPSIRSWGDISNTT